MKFSANSIKQPQQPVSVDGRSGMRFAANSLGAPGKTPHSYGPLRIPPAVLELKT